MLTHATFLRLVLFDNPNSEGWRELNTFVCHDIMAIYPCFLPVVNFMNIYITRNILFKFRSVEKSSPHFPLNF